MSLIVSYDDLEIVGFDAGGGEILNYQGQPFTGIIQEVVDGIVVSEEEFTDGHRGGVQKSYYPSAQLQSRYTIRYNRLEGDFDRWDEKGNLLKHTVWKGGICIEDSAGLL